MEVININNLPKKKVLVNEEKPIFLDPLKVGEILTTSIWNAWKSQDLAWDLGISKKVETFKAKFLRGGIYPEGGLYIEVGNKEIYFENYRKVEEWLADNLSANMPAYIKYKNKINALIIKLTDITAIVTHTALYAIYGEVMHKGSYIVENKPLSLLDHVSGQLAVSFEEIPMIYRIDF